VTEKPNTYRVTFEIDRGKLFDTILKMEHNTGPLGDRIVGLMLMGKTGFADAIGLAFYGITVVEDDARIQSIKALAAEAYANEFALSGGDIAQALSAEGLITQEEFASLVETHSPEAAAAIRSEATAATTVGDDRIPF
jgi:hypothetical protein